MSILIKGMEMPTNCWSCPCVNGENGYCQLRQEYVYGEVPRSCPLIPVPDHGDLIDRDKLMGSKLPNNRVYQGDERFSYPPTVWQILDSISKAPTILPGEEGEE